MTEGVGGPLVDDTPFSPSLFSNVPDFSFSVNEDPTLSTDTPWLHDDFFSDAIGLIGQDSSGSLTDSAGHELLPNPNPWEFPSDGVQQDFGPLPTVDLPEISFGEAAGDCRPGDANERLGQAAGSAEKKKRPREPTAFPVRHFKKPKIPSHGSPPHRSKLSADSKAVLEKFFSINPYPDKDDFTAFEKQINVGVKQLRTWFNNKRNRTSRENTMTNMDHSTKQSSEPSQQTFGSRLANIPHANPTSLLERYLEIPLDQYLRTDAVIQYDLAGLYVKGPASGSGSSWSSCGSQVSWSSRRGRAKMRPSGLFQTDEPYIPESNAQKFSCTFCGKLFRTRFEWKRHEGPSHAPRTGWICKDPKCADKSFDDTIFFRKDWFKQHYDTHAKQNQSQVDSDTGPDQCQVEVVHANPIPHDHPALCCGFCGDRLPDWDSRVEHLAAHFKSGANLSQWWLKRTQFLESIPDWRGQILDLLQLDKLSDAPVICNYCGRLYASVTEGERQHPQCTMWSCGRFGGVQTAFTGTQVPFVWKCIYCDAKITESGPAHSQRLFHLDTKHAYRDCRPSRFRSLSKFQRHLVRRHRARLKGDGDLEKACQLTAKSLFKPMSPDFFQQMLSLDRQTIPPSPEDTERRASSEEI